MVLARFLLDANVLSEPLKPQPNVGVLNQLTQNANTLSTAAMVYYEMQFGCLMMPESAKKQAIMAYIIDDVECELLILDYGLEAARWHAFEQARLRKIGRTPPYADGQIAAIAATNNLTLVTRNIADFQNFQGLKLENWLE